jgi:hypothetical protein
MPQIIMKPVSKPDGRKVYQVTSEWELLLGGLILGAKGAEGSTLAPLAHAEGANCTKGAIPITFEIEVLAA